VINIGTDAEISIPAAADIIARAMGHDSVTWTLKAGLPGSTTTRRPDIAKLRSIWPEYRPRSFAEGMAKIVAHRSK
jgi:nucleoside-diphosphate-sugar epimerase